MREIKVRGYALEKLITDTQWLVGFGVCEIKFADHYAKEVGRISDWWIYTENGEYLVDPKSIGEYTGLKDKNGKEIYEGDIVRLVNMPASPHQEATVTEVFFYNGGFYFKAPFSEEHMALQFITMPSPFANGYVPLECEVIGNIYENPELLCDHNVQTFGPGEFIQTKTDVCIKCGKILNS